MSPPDSQPLGASSLQPSISQAMLSGVVFENPNHPVLKDAKGLNLSACVVFTHRFPPKDTKNRRHHWQTTNHLDQLESVTNHHQQMKIPSGKQT